MSLKKVLFVSKKLKDGTHPVMYRIIRNRKANFLSTGFSCYEKDWDFELKEFKKSFKNYKTANVLLNDKFTELQKAMLNLEIENKNYSSVDLINRYRGSIGNITVLSFLNERINRLKATKQIGNSFVYAD